MGPVEVVVHEFGILKGAIRNFACRKGTELNIRRRKITGIQGGKIEETHTEYRAGKQDIAEHGVGEAASIEMPFSEIQAFQRKARQIIVLYRAVSEHALRKSGRAALCIRMVSGAYGLAC